jgi:SAM-dependent methyltransferase
MNLFDLIRRKDRSLQWIEGGGEPTSLKWVGGTQRGVRFEPRSKLKIVGAHEFTCLKVRPLDIGWRLGADLAGALLRITLSAPEAEERVLAQVEVGPIGDPRPVSLSWPAERRYAEGFDLTISMPKGGLIGVSPQIDMRQTVLPIVRGKGVEVGPGISPSVLPSQDVDVTYVESRSLDQWSAVYAKNSKAPLDLSADVAARYVIDSAVSLDRYAPASLDFIFSNHVFEHLQNPVLVLRNWLHVLKPGGLIAGVTPDPRYTFDCRQPVVTLADALREAEHPGHDIPLEKYQRWSRWTAPDVTPQSLIERDYSIHVNFFTPDTFADVAEYLKASGEIAASSIVAAPNNKDFSFALWKAA